jgi:SOS-response transcriptional repressor LexA
LNYAIDRAGGSLAHSANESARAPVLIARVSLRLRAGISGFETEAATSTGEGIEMPVEAIRALQADPAHLLAIQVRDRGMEPMLFEDDWVVIDTSDTALRNREVYGVNWNGEACVQQLLRRGGEWYLNYLHEDFKPINVRSGQCVIVGRVVYQPSRVLAGRL